MQEEGGGAAVCTHRSGFGELGLEELRRKMADFVEERDWNQVLHLQ